MREGAFAGVNQLCPTRGPRASCGPVDCFVRLGLGFCCSKVSYVLTTCPCFDNVELDIFDAGGPQCHIVTSVTIAVRIRTLSGH